MSPKRVIRAPGGAPALGAYSHAFRVGDLVFVTGTGPIGASGEVVGDDVVTQTHKVIDNIEAILVAAGLTLADVVKVNTYLADATTFPDYDAAYRTRFAEPYPVRTTVGVSLDQVPGMLVEIDCVAFGPDPGDVT